MIHDEDSIYGANDYIISPQRRVARASIGKHTQSSASVHTEDTNDNTYLKSSVIYPSRRIRSIPEPAGTNMVATHAKYYGRMNLGPYRISGRREIIEIMPPDESQLFLSYRMYFS